MGYRPWLRFRLGRFRFRRFEACSDRSTSLRASSRVRFNTTSRRASSRARFNACSYKNAGFNAAASKPAHTAQYPCAHRQTRDSIQARAGHPRAPAHSQGEPRLPTLTRDCGRRWRVPAKARLRASSAVALHECSSERRRQCPARGRHAHGCQARRRACQAPAGTTAPPLPTAAILPAT